ncbi:MAG: PIG-L family deacetylase [Chloroflexi bacterium]|nr:PIG-L family deacetylase [Chloroflexota bacterium]
MVHEFTRVLVLAPHTDDVEFGAGGAVAKWVEEGKEVSYVTFSIAEKSVPEGLPKDILEHEVTAATRVLGITQRNLYIYKFEVRKFPQFRQEILEILVSLRKQLNPELVLLPSLADVHQDHHTIAEEGIRAFKNSNILCYELPWNLFNFTTSLFIPLEKQHLEKKIQSIRCYQSQESRNYASPEFIDGWARTRGVQVNTTYAETFEVVRWILR